MTNNVATGFWSLVRAEFKSRHVVVECKNFRGGVAKREVLQLKDYLSRKSLGKFGLLASRRAPSASALHARGRAYEDENVLILFLSDDHFTEMIFIHRDGSDPSVVLARQKEQFELEY